MIEKLYPSKMTQLKVFVGASITTISSASISLADVGDGFYHHGMSWGGGWFLGPIFMILLLVVIVGVIVTGFRLLGSASGQPPKDRSIEILNERFAKGEIDEEEFKKRKDLLHE